jgi:hypothetical protein
MEGFAFRKTQGKSGGKKSGFVRIWSLLSAGWSWREQWMIAEG